MMELISMVTAIGFLKLHWNSMTCGSMGSLGCTTSLATSRLALTISTKSHSQYLANRHRLMSSRLYVRSRFSSRIQRDLRCV